MTDALLECGTGDEFIERVRTPMRSIWFGQGWGTAARNVPDGPIYALLTGGVFGWLWP